MSTTFTAPCLIVGCWFLSRCCGHQKIDQVFDYFDVAGIFRMIEINGQICFPMKVSALHAGMKYLTRQAL